MKGNQWARLLAFVTGLVNQELLLQNEYLAPENRILRAHLPARLRLSDPERRTLAEIGKRLGRKALTKVACVAKPDTILAWYRHPHRPQIRSFPISYPSWPPPGLSRGGGTGGSLHPRELRLGIRPHRRRAGQPGSSYFVTRLWAISCAATTSHRLPSGVKRRVGRNSSAATWTCSPEPISSPSRC